MAKETLVPSRAPDADPSLGISDILRWEPVLAEIVTAIETAVSGGSTTVPAIKVRIAGKRITYGPAPLLVE